MFHGQITEIVTPHAGRRMWHKHIMSLIQHQIKNHHGIRCVDITVFFEKKTVHCTCLWKTL